MISQKKWSDWWLIAIGFSAAIGLALAFVEIGHKVESYVQGEDSIGRFKLQRHGRVGGSTIWTIQDGADEYLFVDGAIIKLGDTSRK
jgi:hypothetical protein